MKISLFNKFTSLKSEKYVQETHRNWRS